MAEQPSQEIIIADPVNFQIVALKNFAEIYYIIKHLGREEYALLLDAALEEGMPDGAVDKIAVGAFWNERVSSPIFQVRDIEPPPPLIIT